MGFRRRSREYALQMLYQYDLTRDRPVEELLSEFWMGREASEEVKEFSRMLVLGVLTASPVIDAHIRSCAENWSLERISAVDRNILRIAIYEFFFAESIPVKVSINEAIEIAKKFGQEDSAPFVNGVLDRVVRENKEQLTDKLSFKE